MAGPVFKVALATLVLFQSWTAAHVKRQRENQWVDIWGSMPQLNATGVVFQDATIRQTIFLTQSAPKIRLVISNVFSGSDLPISAATIAVPLNGSAGTSAVEPETLVPLTFSGGLPNFTIPNGARIVSDPVDFPVTAQQVLTISLYLATGQTTNSITGHPGSRTTSFYAPGNQTGEADLSADPATQSSAHWYFISAVEAYLPTSETSGALAVVGDSITDGRGSTTDQNNRWPDNLVRRLQAANATALQRGLAVVNQAAGGNRVLADGLGPNALGRIDRDVLAQSGVRYVIVFEGVNDIGTAAADSASQQAVGDRLLAAYAQIIVLVHARGLPIFGATITPFGGDASVQAYSDPTREVTRQRVNEWIRTSGWFDGVVDFDAAVRDPTNETMLSPLYDSGDYLHLNPAGYVAMAQAVDLSLFEKFRDGVDEEI
ncbi:GDSL-like Lipase/Acylhydrolase [Diaporthe helianthi]|uniref:GDSL-like Lipase/Acylhydrolase n=1 Tax=Diaporthe helianthi TaxID=158607 RepID=A0A2P5I6E1_DIAHE|nr:GDSL-like Lipase/Acylhydrolase [Diaporthe helianthi]